MKIIIVLLALFAASCFAAMTEKELQVEFTMWMQQHGKSYSVDEFQYRYQVFKTNARFIENFSVTNRTFRVAMNQFGDLTVEEFSKIYLGFAGDRAVTTAAREVAPLPNIPTSIDWRQKGAVTQIKNQGQCGSCWSFSTTGSCEGAHFLGTGSLVSLSEQQLVDCSGSYGNQGCNGGLMDDAFQYIMAIGGLESESQYPYTAADGYCQFNKADVVATINGYHDVTSGSESALTNAIGSISPISVAIDASQSSFQFYSGGVYYEPACSSTQLDHGVLAVGYGTSSGSDYYIVKNSWGTDWGMNGYIWMSRNRNNNCGIATMASYPCAQGESDCPATI